MAWTSPRTWVTGETVTAAQMNTHIRDNLLETAAATATAAGDVVYADASKSMGSRLAHPGQSRMLVSDASSALAWRQPAEDIDWLGTLSASLSNTTYSGSGDTDSLPSVTVTTGTLAIVFVSAARLSNDTAGARVNIAFSISGATTLAATDATGAIYESSNAGDFGAATVVRLVTLTAGSNTFQMEALVSSGVGTILRPRILVLPF